MNSLAPEITNETAPQNGQSGTDFFTLRDIACACRANKRTVARHALAQNWPRKSDGNKFLFAPPAHIAQIMLAGPGKLKGERRTAPRITFAHIAQDPTQTQKVLLRESAVKLLVNNLGLGEGVAVEQVVAHFRAAHPLFRISARALREWRSRYQFFGIDGLVEQKRGVVGARAFAEDLNEDQLLQLRADAVEHGIKGRLNTARAFRNLVSNPTLEGPARAWAHGDYASKTYVPPSVRAAARVPALAVRLIQQGPKAAKLDGPFTECSYENVKAGDAFTADDMTCNVYVWCEWPNEDGYLMIRPQLLAVMDIGSLAWLNFRVVMRPKGQYNKDDVWGTIGDTLDAHGLFKIAVLEGGTWQSDVIIGQRTNIDDETRFGGLRSLGVQVIHTRTPRGKIIEGQFNTLQHAMDNVPGFCGRMEMKDCPEITKQHLALVRAGHAHPRQHFLHVNDFSKHIEGVMTALNNERNDGKILRGTAPVDKWAEDAPQLRLMPDEAKWMYRSSFRIVGVTRNGVRITVGSGKYQTAYTYTHPALEQHRGRRVVAFWNEHDPDTDAVIYTVRDGRQDKLICVASRMNELPRFGATDEAFKAEATRKKLVQQMAVAESRRLSPYLQRQAAPGGASVPASRGLSAASPHQDIMAARQHQAEKVETQNRIRREVNQAGREITPSDVESALLPAREDARPSAEFSPDEIANLFESDH